MDQYGPAFLTLGSFYIVWSIFRYMLDNCRRQNDLAVVARTLYEINERLKSTPFEAVCLCDVCVDGKARRRSIAEHITIPINVADTTPTQKIEGDAIGITE